MDFTYLKNKLGFDIEISNHADAIFAHAFPDFETNLCRELSNFYIEDRELIEGGGGEAPFTQRLRKSFAALGWVKHNFEISKVVDGEPKGSTSHEIDHVYRSKNGIIVLEIEWNNKTEFFDRDLENFKRLHSEDVFSAAALITRGKSIQENMPAVARAFIQRHNINSFQDFSKFPNYDPSRKFISAVEKECKKKKLGFVDVWPEKFSKSKYATSTTHWEKLTERIDRGVGSPCPTVFIGLPDSIIKPV